MKEEKGNYSPLESMSSNEQLESRGQLEKLFRDCPMSTDELMTQLGLYIRGSYLVKFLVLNDLYLRIKDLPGDIFEFGTRFGHNMVVFENLRAIYEPFNKTRKIIGFDTFEGYKNLSDQDANSEVYKEETYTTFDNYETYLENLLKVHEQNNVIGHSNGNHRVVKGDVTKTSKKYFAEYPESVVALAYFDMGLYNPTKAALEAIKNHLIPGSIILLDEYNWVEAPGETIAFKEVFGQKGYKIEKSKFTPMRAIITIE
ncbi:class I SAM-dependent methyltransferase [Flavobacteriaceae bacterium]|nr:class I SAM-dependent methyltransferase [Flavobacteriaceae bacterium]